jgi:hypothetical protein
MNKQALLKFKGYLEYELHRKGVYTVEYRAVLEHFLDLVNEMVLTDN